MSQDSHCGILGKHPQTQRCLCSWGSLCLDAPGWSVPPSSWPGSPADYKSPPLSGRASVCSCFKREGQESPCIPPLRWPVKRPGAAEEKGGLYAHRQEGTTSPPRPPTMPSGERSLCDAPRLARADTEPSPSRRRWQEALPRVRRGRCHRSQMGRPLGPRT